MMNNTLLIDNLKQFLRKLSAKDYTSCRKKAQQFKNSNKVQWSNLALNCLENVCSYQKQLNEQKQKYHQLLKLKNQKIEELDKIIKLKKETRQLQDLKQNKRLKIFYLLQAELYEEAFNQQIKAYGFLHHLKEYECLVKMWNNLDDDDIILNEPQSKSEFYCDVKRLFKKRSKSEQQFIKYALKVANGEGLQQHEKPQHLSSKINQFLQNLHQNLKNPSNYQNSKQINERSDPPPQGVIKIFKKIYRQFFQKQFTPQAVETVTLQSCFEILREDLKIWIQIKNQQKFAYISQLFNKFENLAVKNLSLLKSIDLYANKIRGIQNNLITMDIQFIFPKNQQNIEQALICISTNTKMLGQSMQLYKKQGEQYKRRLMQLQRLLQDKQIQMEKYRMLKRQIHGQQKRRQQTIDDLQKKMKIYCIQIQKYRNQIDELKKNASQREIIFERIRNQEKQKQQKLIQSYKKQAQNKEKKYHTLFVDYNNIQAQLLQTQNQYSQLLREMEKRLQQEQSFNRKRQNDRISPNNLQNKDVRAEQQISKYQQQIHDLKCKVFHLEAINIKYARNKINLRENQKYLEQQIQLQRQRYQQESSRKFSRIQSSNILERNRLY